jgi:hypothetical protein
MPSTAEFYRLIILCGRGIHAEGAITLRLGNTNEGSQGRGVTDLKTILNEIDLSVLALHFYDGFSLREIGQMYGIHKQSVKDRIDKCKRILTKNGIPLPKRLEQPKPTGPTVPIDPHTIDGWCESEEDDGE